MSLFKPSLVKFAFRLENAQTERLTFRSLTLNDVDEWTKFASNKLSMKFFDLDGLSPNAFSESWIMRQLARYDDYGYGLAALIEKNTGNFVGQCGLLTQEVNGKTEIEVGYSLLPDHQGKGFASEAAIFCKEFAFANKLADSVISLIHPENQRSIRVAEKNGMKPEGMTKYKQFDVVVYRVYNR